MNKKQNTGGRIQWGRMVKKTESLYDPEGVSAT